MKNRLFRNALILNIILLVFSGCSANVSTLPTALPNETLSASLAETPTPSPAEAPAPSPVTTLSPTPSPTPVNKFKGIYGARYSEYIVESGGMVYYCSGFNAPVVFGLDGSGLRFLAADTSIGSIICNRDGYIYFTGYEFSDDIQGILRAAADTELLTDPDNNEYCRITSEFIYQHPHKQNNLYPLGNDDEYMYFYYYVDLYDYDSKVIIRVSYDGQAKEIAKITARDIALCGDKIYYSNLGKRTIYRMDTDGRNKKKICEGVRAGSLCAQDGWLYFSVFEDYDIYRVNIDGGKPQRVGEANGWWLNAAGGYVFYANELDGKKLYRINIDGGTPEKLDEGFNVISICIFDGRIFFRYSEIENNASNDLACVFFDGTERIEIKLDE